MTHKALDEKRLARVCWALRQRAWAGGPYRGSTGQRDMAYLMSCSHMDALTQTRLFFTRDEGHHTSGWWKNPDYERCLHLSISPAPHPTPPDDAVDFSKAVQSAWARAFFAENIRWVWAEPPYSAQGKASEVWHFRLFTDPSWRPMLPRGEVYGRELTAVGWRSASEVLELGQDPAVLLIHQEQK